MKCVESFALSYTFLHLGKLTFSLPHKTDLSVVCVTFCACNFHCMLVAVVVIACMPRCCVVLTIGNN